MLQMFYVTVWSEVIDFDKPDEAIKNLKRLKDSPILFSEMMSLLEYKQDHIDFVDKRLDFGFECSLILIALTPVTKYLLLWTL